MSLCENREIQTIIFDFLRIESVELSPHHTPQKHLASAWGKQDQLLYPLYHPDLVVLHVPGPPKINRAPNWPIKGAKMTGMDIDEFTYTLLSLFY